jgi:hypothetical protein
LKIIAIPIVHIIIPIFPDKKEKIIAIVIKTKSVIVAPRI